MTVLARGISRGLGSPRVAAIALALGATFAALAWRAGPPRGAIAELFGTRTLEGPRLLYRIVPDIDPRLITRDAAAPRHSFSARWTASWWIARDTDLAIEAAADDRAEIAIDGRRVIVPAADPGIQHSDASIALTRGFHLLTVDYEQVDGGMFLDITTSAPGGEPRPLGEQPLFAVRTTQQHRSAIALARVLWAGAALCLVTLAACLAVQRTTRSARLAAALALAAILVFAAALRLDALLGRIGPVEQPRWLQSLDRSLRLPLSRLTPAEFQWVRVPRMYHEGDPAAYLRFAHEMTSFYAAHPREPLFIAFTRTLLPLVAQQDVAVGLASLLSSLLLIGATYLLGTSLGTRFAGLAAAFALAIERDAVAWSVEGWRDELFAFFFVIALWLFVRAQRRGGAGSALALGVAAAGALLTRVTSLSFLAAGLAALAWFFWRRAPDPRRDLARPLALTLVAIGTAAVLAGPYFLNCATTFGDPLYAIDVHTRFYRDREGLPSRAALGAGSYIRSRFVDHPIRLTGTFVTGMTSYPFLNKWRGFDDWSRIAAPLAAACSLIGLLLLTSREEGRLVLAMTAASLVPYAFTHDIQGGAEWRFTMHVYPVLLIAAAIALERSATAVPAWKTTAHEGLEAVRRHPRRVAAAVTVVLTAAVLARLWPYVEIGEDLLFDRPYSVLADQNHRLLFSRAWSEPVQAGNVVTRSSIGASASVWVPIVRQRRHHMRLRLDPTGMNGSGRSALYVYVNHQLIATAKLQLTDGRIGAYDVDIPEPAVHRGLNRVDLQVSPADETDADDDLADGIRLWYVRLSGM
jgi:hypothetical protein